MCEEIEMRDLIRRGKADKLWGGLVLCWLATVFFSFFNSYLFSFSLPVIGTLFPFRILLPVTAVLYLVWAVKNRESFWADTPALEKWCYVLIAVLIVYGAVSLFRAMDFMWTFRRLFNLCFDLCFFFLMLRLCRDKQVLKATLALCLVMLAVISALGIYEVFCGGIVDPAYDDYKRLYIFRGLYQYPIVFSGNTNDYSSLLIFLFSVLLLALLWPGKELHRSGRAWIVLMGTIVYFLALAGNSRLCMAAFVLLYIGIFLYFLIRQKRRLLVPLLLLLGVLSMEFITQYRYIVPPIQQYIAELQEYHAQQAENPGVSAENPGTSGENPGTSADSPSVDEPQKPSLTLGDPNKQTLDEEFFTTDEETGEKVLRDVGSGGVRARLLIHAFNCLVESRGLGVGLGNTETLAARRAVIPKWADKPQNSIHCFIARLVADYGIFALLPLCVIGFLLLKRIFQTLLAAIREKDRDRAAYAVLFLFLLLIYPIVSTASSDAQDNIPMWIYLAAVVLFANAIAAESAHAKEVRNV